jgi:hypothetical protein
VDFALTVRAGRMTLHPIAGPLTNGRQRPRQAGVRQPRTAAAAAKEIKMNDDVAKKNKDGVGIINARPEMRRYSRGFVSITLLLTHAVSFFAGHRVAESISSNKADSEYVAGFHTGFHFGRGDSDPALFGAIYPVEQNEDQ